MCADGNIGLTVRVKRKLLVGTLQVELGESFPTVQLDKDILWKRDWIEWDIELWVDCDRVVTT